MKKGIMLVGLFAAIMVGACAADKDAEPAKTTPAENAVAEIDPSQYDLSGTPVTIGGVTFTPPTDWADLGPSGMRKASYYYGPLETDTDSATVTVFYFGPTGGGSIDANIDRWIGQMVMADGGDPKAAAKRSPMTVGEMNVHVVSVDGGYTGSMGGPMGGGGAARENYRMVGVVVEAPEGNVFFKLTGPVMSAEKMTGGFLAMIKEIVKA